ncbi:hybrid sensor histidine kinase/response regulator, partial [candidate division KSB1 bacterium]
GPGIDDNIKEKIFHPFFTTKEIGKGTGLGLSTSYGIIKKHNGELYVDNSYKNGAKFVIKLPVNIKPNRKISEIKDITAEGYKYNGKIIVIDDEKSILDLAKSILEEKGFMVDIASSGTRAIELIKNNHYDVIVTDIKMPGKIDGRVLYEVIKIEKPDLINKIIFITGDIVSNDTKEFLNDKSNLYILKPFTIDKLLNTVVKVFNG